MGRGYQGKKYNPKTNKTQDDWTEEKRGLKKKKEAWRGFTDHGNMHEPTALRLFAERYKKELFDVGCVTWLDAVPSRMFESDAMTSLYETMGGSPDSITTDMELVEVKCPLKRAYDPHDPIPYYYVDQVQFYMWQFDLPKCYFVQYFPYAKAGSPEELRVDVIPRDKNWWSDSLPTFRRLHALLK